MDFDFILRFVPMYAQAGWLTIKLATLGIIASLALGLACAISYYFNRPILSKIVSCYIELSRNTPLLIQLFFLYYGLPKIGIHISSFTCALIALIFLGGGYMAESFRLGLEAIRCAQYESALSLGLSKASALRYVILPQALRISLPSISANVIFLIKETSVVSVIALADLVYATKDIIGLYYRTNEALFLLVASYLIIILPVSLGLSYLEKRLNYARA
ncbi:amino acid ABC transporter permease [Campylobacter sp. 19-13652]|uniref:amino acid ABC transporter permease n=1 Tax=Campylobacter sp. 19-13652 TaxID=2840180 RepID=UPI001C7578BE|nr:amino acid ABC transporter permease [Campylobacter sp. 19-13652]BCX78919.1 polar amino acid ABC transporter permease [Campylobacter sp. 19-13652]